MGKRIEVGLWRTASYVRKGADLYHQRMRNLSLEVQPDDALRNPPWADGSMSTSPLPGGKCMGTLSDHSEFPTRSPGCKDFQDDIAVLAIGALGGCERSELLCHLGFCVNCAALHEELSKVARALEVLFPLPQVRPI